MKKLFVLYLLLFVNLIAQKNEIKVDANITLHFKSITSQEAFNHVEFLKIHFKDKCSIGVGQHASEMYIIYDTVHRDYLGRRAWVKEKESAKIFYSKEAVQNWLKVFRENEDGEYSNSGEEDYPVVIQRIKQPIN